MGISQTCLHLYLDKKKIHHLPPALPDCWAFSSSQCWLKRLPSPLTNCSPISFLRASKLRFHWRLIFLNIFRVYDGLWWSMFIYLRLHLEITICPWLVAEPYPSEKWWSESQLGWWHSQYMESHESHVPNHQPVPVTLIHGVSTERRFLLRRGSRVAQATL